MTEYRVAVVGAGAAGTLTAARLAEFAADRRVRVRVHLVDPAGSTGRGRAYGTDDAGHLLNVPACRMSARAEDPDDFLRWLGARESRVVDPAEFAARRDYGRYLADVLGAAPSSTDGLLDRVHAKVLGVWPEEHAVSVVLDSGAVLNVDAVVLALGNLPPKDEWVPSRLRTSNAFIGDPWAPDALARVPEDSDVLLVGSGLTMVDLALSLDRPGRVVHAISRNGLLPRAHARGPLPTGRPPVLPVGEGLDVLRAVVLDELRECRRRTGDWRPAFDSLRPVTNALWRGLSLADRARFLERDRRVWEVHRHRMPPQIAAAVSAMRKAGRLRVGVGEIVDAVEVAGALDVRFADGRSMSGVVVVNCAGGGDQIGKVDDILVRQLLFDGVTRPGPLGLGFDATGEGRLVSLGGHHDAPLWAVGALRRGNLWETTAIPEIRGQAAEVATAVLADLTARSPRRTRRPRDRYGLPLSTTPEAARHFQAGLDRILRVEAGAAEAMAAAVAADPGFALGHAALALADQLDPAADPAAALRAARAAVRDRGDDRERGFVAAVGELVTTSRSAALLRHIRLHPMDALAVSVAVPTIAFGGVTAGRDTWELVEGLASAYGDDWWYLSQLAFVRQDQERWEEADALAVRALEAEPGAGHAVHARTHVFYETGLHADGLSWLDGWIGEHGRRANQLAHFSWHAALHEIMLGDRAAVRRRYACQLAPPVVTGPRALVDSASLLWRCRVTNSWDGPVPLGPVLDAVPPGWLTRPPTAFAALHSAVALAAAADETRLDELRRHAANHSSPVFREVVAPLCEGLSAVTRQRWSEAVDILQGLTTRLVALGGSAAQRDVIEETLLYAQIHAGRRVAAARLLDSRLDRRPSTLDARRLAKIKR